eukprot:346468_1
MQKSRPIHRVPSWKGSRGSLFYGSTSLPAPLLDECFKTFNKFAVNSDENNKKGYIPKQDLPKAFQDLGIFLSDLTKKDLNKIMILIDDKECTDLTSFCRLIRSIRLTFIDTIHSEDIKRQQNVLVAWSCVGGNKDKTGTIPISKIKGLLSVLDVQFDVDKQLKEVVTDIDINGSVGYDEFKALFKEM